MKNYTAKLATVVEGKPYSEGELIRNLSEDKAKAYLKAGVIEEDKGDEPSKDEKKADNVFQEAAKVIDRSEDKRVQQ